MTVKDLIDNYKAMESARNYLDKAWRHLDDKDYATVVKKITVLHAGITSDGMCLRKELTKLTGYNVNNGNQVLKALERITGV